MAVVGLIFIGFMTWSTPIFGQPNHYYVQGVGYATILDVLRGDLTAPVFLLVLAAAKLLVTCLTLGSGASGGVFSPALFLGAAVGAALGGLLQGVAPGLALAPTHFAIAGMAGMIAGTTGATITAIVMVFEMTWDYGAILPIMLTAAVAYVVRQHLSPASIYTLKLLRRGDVVPQGLQAWLLGARRAEDVMSKNFTVGEASPIPDPPPSGPDRPEPLRVVVSEGRIAGVAPDGARRGLLAHVVVEPQDRLGAVLRAMTQAGAAVALVSATRTSGSPRDLVGVITDREIAATTRATAHLME
jgi:CIC family chloride channel protein